MKIKGGMKILLIRSILILERFRHDGADSNLFRIAEGKSSKETMNRNIKDLPGKDRPREKLQQKGLKDYLT